MTFTARMVLGGVASLFAVAHGYWPNDWQWWFAVLGIGLIPDLVMWAAFPRRRGLARLAHVWWRR